MQATGDSSYSIENESMATFITATNRKAAIMVWSGDVHDLRL